MKKHFVTFATAAAMASPMAIMADANAEWFDIYGRVHVSLDMEAYDDANGDSGSFAVHDRSSRLGIRGNRDLDAGVNVFYQYELGLFYQEFQNLQQVLDGGMSQRDTFIGFSSDGFGSLRTGRLPAGNAIVYGAGANFFPTMAGDAGNVINAVTPFGGRVGITDNKNPIEYTAPIAGPLGVIVTFVPSAVDTPDDQQHDFMVRATFADGPIDSQFTLAQHNHDADDADTVIAAQGSFDMGGGMKVGGGLVMNSSDLDDNDNMALWFGGAMQMTPAGTVKAQLSQFMGDADDTDSTIIAVGYDHALAAQTTLYAALAIQSNDEFPGADGMPHTYASSAETTTIGGDEDATVVSFGVTHNF